MTRFRIQTYEQICVGQWDGDLHMWIITIMDIKGEQLHCVRTDPREDPIVVVSATIRYMMDEEENDASNEDES